MNAEGEKGKKEKKTQKHRKKHRIGKKTLDKNVEMLYNTDCMVIRGVTAHGGPFTCFAPHMQGVPVPCKAALNK